MDYICNVCFFTPTAETPEQNSQQQRSRTPVSMNKYLPFVKKVILLITLGFFFKLFFQGPFLAASSQPHAKGQEQYPCRAKKGNFKMSSDAKNPSVISHSAKASDHSLHHFALHQSQKAFQVLHPVFK